MLDASGDAEGGRRLSGEQGLSTLTVCAAVPTLAPMQGGRGRRRRPQPGERSLLAAPAAGFSESLVSSSRQTSGEPQFLKLTSGPSYFGRSLEAGKED